MKNALPAEIQSKMKAWRDGLADFPQEYVEFHESLAKAALGGLGLKVHNSFMASDGWADGMQSLVAVVERASGERLKLQWHDGNQEFFVQTPGGGSSPLR